MFYDTKKNVESVVLFKLGCCQVSIEEFSENNARISFVERDNNNFLSEYDSNRNFKYKVINYNHFGNAMKFFDINNNEIDLSDSSLFNDGFTKIQIILILRMLFQNNYNAPQYNHYNYNY